VQLLHDNSQDQTENEPKKDKKNFFKLILFKLTAQEQINIT